VVRWVVGKLESNAKLNSKVKVEVEVEVGVELGKNLSLKDLTMKFLFVIIQHILDIYNKTIFT